MKDTFYGYIDSGSLFGIFYKEDNSLKNVIKELGFCNTKELFNKIEWASPQDCMSKEEAEFISYDYPLYLFIELCRTKSIEETLKTQYGIMKFLNSRSDDPVFDGILDEKSEKELQEKTKKTLKDLKNTKILELFNQAYKLKGDYRNTRKYYIVDFDEKKVREKEN